MKQKRYTDEQIAFALRQADSDTAVAEICRKLGVSEPTFFRWKKKLTAEETRRGERKAEAAGRRPQSGQDDAAGSGPVAQTLRKNGEARAAAGWGCCVAATGSASVGLVRQWAFTAHSNGIGRDVIRRSRCGCGCVTWLRLGSATATGGCTCCCGGVRRTASDAAGWLAGEPQTHLSALRPGGAVDPHQAAAAQAGLTLPPSSLWSGSTERGAGHGFHVGVSCSTAAQSAS
jgi:transposase-like protein